MWIQSHKNNKIMSYKWLQSTTGDTNSLTFAFHSHLDHCLYYYYYYWNHYHENHYHELLLVCVPSFMVTSAFHARLCTFRGRYRCCVLLVCVAACRQPFLISRTSFICRVQSKTYVFLSFNLIEVPFICLAFARASAQLHPHACSHCRNLTHECAMSVCTKYTAMPRIWKMCFWCVQMFSWCA